MQINVVSQSIQFAPTNANCACHLPNECFLVILSSPLRVQTPTVALALRVASIDIYKNAGKGGVSDVRPVILANGSDVCDRPMPFRDGVPGEDEIAQHRALQVDVQVGEDIGHVDRAGK